jgi:hypothetical protein
MIAQKLVFIFLSALLVAAIIATPLSMIPALQPARKHFWQRFGYAFMNWGVPVWCVIELLLWLITKRWVPWIP